MLTIVDLGDTFGMSGARVFHPWEELGEAVITVPRDLRDFAETARDADLVIFGGGGDIHPSWYNHPVRGAAVGLTPSIRDVNEFAAYKICIQHKIPVFGICRGAQLACIQAGGELIQHVTGHSFGHEIIDLATKNVYRMSSMHHQMMWPERTQHRVIATVTKNISTCYDGAMSDSSTRLESFVEPEIIFFPQIHSLAVQGHPEVFSPDSETVKYCRKLVNNFLLKGAAPNV